MINVLSYIGMNVHSEVCLWTLLGLVRTIFDATLFRVNANLKQVWQMSMPEELSMPVQRVLRTMISGVMLVQCFTVYVYLASYIVLLYPVFLEERPNLVLPWLLLAAVRKLLCELTSLALGLGTCVLLGAARPACIKFVVIKLISIMPAFYMWMLLYSYYHALKVSTAFKTFPAVLAPGDQDYGLELAIRRRRTKSLLREEQLRSKIVASLYGERNPSNAVTTTISKIGISSRMIHSTDTSAMDVIQSEPEAETLHPNSFNSNLISDTGFYEDWFGSEVVLPRSCDRILEQFVLMLFRIRAYLDKEGMQPINLQNFNAKSSHPSTSKYDENLNCSSISTDDAETPLLVGSSRLSNTSSYLQEYPQIFMKKLVDVARNENIVNLETNSLEADKVTNRRKYVPDDKNPRHGKIDADQIHHQRFISLTTTTSKQVKQSSENIQFEHRDIGTEKASFSRKETSIKLQSDESVQSTIQSCKRNKPSLHSKDCVLLEVSSDSSNDEIDKHSDNGTKKSKSNK